MLGLDSRFNHGPESNLSLPLYKLINQVWSHAWSFQIQLKESVIVSQSPGCTKRESMSHTDIGSQLRGQVDQLGREIWGGRGEDKKARLRCWNKGKASAVQEQGGTPRRTSSVSGKNVIKQPVRCELSHILRGNIFVEGLQLGLALIELLMVTLTNTNKQKKNPAVQQMCSQSVLPIEQTDCPNKSPFPERCVRGTRTLPPWIQSEFPEPGGKQTQHNLRRPQEKKS